MNDQDRDLIASLAEGRLSGTAAENARARIEADPALASEYAAQVAALEFLDTADMPTMTSSEREMLHASLADKLGLGPAVPSTAPQKRRTPWWQPAFGLVTAAAVVAAVVILPGQLANDGDAAFTVAGAEVSTDQERVATTEASVQEVSPEATSEAPEASLHDISNEDGTFFVRETDTVELDELLSKTQGADSPEAVTRLLGSDGSESMVDLDSDKYEKCLEDLHADLPPGILQILVLGADVSEGVTVVNLGFDFGEGIQDGLSFVLDDCSLVEHGPQG